jgi:hypothetical protein
LTTYRFARNTLLWYWNLYYVLRYV